MMNVFSKFKVALLGTILSFGLIASAEIKGVTEVSATGETEPTTVTDVITADSLGLTGAAYNTFNNVEINGGSPARYSGTVAKDKKLMKINKVTPNGIISSVSGGLLKSITVEWPKQSARVLNIYTSATAFSSTKDLYSEDLIVSNTIEITAAGGTNKVTFSADNIKFFGIRPKVYSLLLSKITVEWVPSTFGTLDSVTVTNPGITRYVVGETYSKEGVTAIKTDTNGNQASIDSTEIKTKLDGHTFSEADVPSMTNAVTYDGKESSQFNVEVYSKSSFVKVTTAKEDWTGTYIIVAQKDEDYFAFDSSLDPIDTINNNKKVVDTNGVIADAIYLSVKIEKYLTGYSIQSYNGSYIGTTTASNGINSKTTKLLNTISFDGTDGVTIACDVKGSPMTMRFNSDAGQERFRYYKSAIAGMSVALYEYKATESVSLTNWANQINNALRCNNGVNPPNVDTWNNIKTTYFDNVIKAVDLEIIRNEVANPNGTNLQKALAKYDYIISKYGDTQYQNYLERNISIGKANVFGIASNSNLPLISILSLMGIGSILGATFLLKKKKENK